MSLAISRHSRQKRFSILALSSRLRNPSLNIVKASSRLSSESASNSMQTAALPLVLKGMFGLSLTRRG